METKKLIVSTSPHFRSKDSVKLIMYLVVIALLPTAIVGIYFYGLPALKVILFSVLTAVITEYIIQKFRKVKVTVQDGSAALTGLLLALTLPPNLPFYIPVIGSFFAIAIGKQIFGGLGYNPFNPALLGRAFLLAAWPVSLTTTWQAPTKVIGLSGILQSKLVAVLQPSGNEVLIEALSSATPLNLLKQVFNTIQTGELSQEIGDKVINLLYSTDNLFNLMIGRVGGSIGEACAILIILAGLFLIIRKIITWHIPVSYILTVAVFAWIFGGQKGAFFTGNPLFHIFAGGLMLGAFFMATDYVTSPMTSKGKLIFGVGAGLLVVIIRRWGGYPEGVCYSILLMNMATPLIDRFTKPKVFGFTKPDKD
ncbi:RnfABCDGE type electron transport complex subunit D [Candidatus Dependentiae bacterium]|nr:RnfABCDGE type electron transport complex subunit D [Candidatus Dependentiae bacterium]